MTRGSRPLASDSCISNMQVYPGICMKIKGGENYSSAESGAPEFQIPSPEPRIPALMILKYAGISGDVYENKGRWKLHFG